jgi:class 3 adenylate cyclase
MALIDDLNSKVIETFDTNWKERQGRQVPEPQDIQLGNDAITLQGAVLYADLAESTDLVQGHKAQFAAEVYKSYLYCASKIIVAEGGVITAFDGDRVMGVFVGDSKEKAAARCALKINHAVVKAINPALEKKYPGVTYRVKQAVGVDVSTLFVARTGIRGSNDLVWVGRAANYAAKLCALRDGNYSSWITKDIFDALDDSLKTSKSGASMWEARTWTARQMTVYCSSWMWTP